MWPIRAKNLPEVTLSGVAGILNLEPRRMRHIMWGGNPAAVGALYRTSDMVGRLRCTEEAQLTAVTSLFTRAVDSIVSHAIKRHGRTGDGQGLIMAVDHDNQQSFFAANCEAGCGVLYRQPHEALGVLVVGGALRTMKQPQAWWAAIGTHPEQQLPVELRTDSLQEQLDALLVVSVGMFAVANSQPAVPRQWVRS